MGYYPAAPSVRLLSPQLGAADTLSAAVITTTETAFATSYALPANYLTTNKALRIVITGGHTTSGTPPTLGMKLRLQKAGPTNVDLFTHNPIASPASVTDRGWAITFVIQGTAAPGASVGVYTGMLMTLPIGGANLMNLTAQPVLVDTASIQTIQLTITYSAGTAGNTITLHQMLVEALN